MGTGLAIACALKGYKLYVVMSAGNSLERQRAIRALGAKVVLVPQVNGTPGQVTGDDLKRVEVVTNELTARLKGFRADQFKNPSSVKAHYTGTGPEIWKQTGGKVDVYVGVVGSSGSFTGIVRYLKRKNPKLRAVVVEPTAASILSGKRKKPGRHKLQGVGYMEVPQLYEPDLVDEFISIGDAEAMRTARKLAKTEGILAGFTTGANVAAALRIARRSRKRAEHRDDSDGFGAEVFQHRLVCGVKQSDSRTVGQSRPTRGPTVSRLGQRRNRQPPPQIR